MRNQMELEWQKLEAQIKEQRDQDVYFYNSDRSLSYVGKCQGHRQFFPGTLECSLSEDAHILQPLMIEDDDHWLWELAYWAEIKMAQPTFRIGDVDYYNEVMALSYTGINSWTHAVKIYNHLVKEGRIKPINDTDNDIHNSGNDDPLLPK